MPTPWSASPLTPELFKHAKQLKWLHITSAGVETHGRQIGLFPELVESNVVVTNAKNVYGPQIADHAFAFLLALTRKLNVTIPQAAAGGMAGGTRRHVRTATARPRSSSASAASAARSRSAPIGFGMKVIGVDIRDVPTSNVIQRVVPPDSWMRCCRRRTWSSSPCRTPTKSEGMMGAREFELMKQGSYFIAMSRGKIYDHGALVKALDSRRLAGVGLDATDPGAPAQGSSRSGSFRT